MVSFISKGRYGNFMFVACAAYAYSLKHGLGFHIQDKSLAEHLWPLYHQDLKNPNWNPDLETVYVNDNQHPYRELEFKEEWRDKNIIIGTTDINTGYFQSYRYLKGYEDEIRIKFGLPVEYTNNKISCHIRRGDFLTYSDRHPVITKTYIESAVSVLYKKEKLIAYYSDDIEWVKNNYPERYVDVYGNHFNIKSVFMEGESVEEDFKGIMKGEHIITSNSSFSVLAAILAPNTNKIVVCPRNFFGEGNKHLDTSTLYPHGWIKMDY